MVPAWNRAAAFRLDWGRAQVGLVETMYRLSQRKPLQTYCRWALIRCSSHVAAEAEASSSLEATPDFKQTPSGWTPPLGTESIFWTTRFHPGLCLRVQENRLRQVSSPISHSESSAVGMGTCLCTWTTRVEVVESSQSSARLRETLR
jgi:hypothetical protein